MTDRADVDRELLRLNANLAILGHVIRRAELLLAEGPPTDAEAGGGQWRDATEAVLELADDEWAAVCVDWERDLLAGAEARAARESEDLMNLIHQHLTAAGIDCPDTDDGSLCHDLAAALREAGWTR